VFGGSVKEVVCDRRVVQKESDRVDEEGSGDFLRERWVLQYVGSDGGAVGVGDNNDFIEVVRGEDSRDRETGGLTIQRGASYPIADREYLHDDDTEVGIFFGEFPDKREVGQQPNPYAM